MYLNHSKTPQNQRNNNNVREKKIIKLQRKQNEKKP